MPPLATRLHPRLVGAIRHRLGWRELRPIQELAGSPIIAGNNVMLIAPTAGGKTEASFFPLISGLLEDEPDGVAILYVTPLKALLNNQEPRLKTYFEMVGLSVFKWHGDVSQSEKRRFKAEPSTLLMTTPESLEAMFMSASAPVPSLFANLRTIVIDEVHAFAGEDRGAQLVSLLERLQLLNGRDIQRIGLSATVGNPTDLLDWFSGSSTRSREVVQAPAISTTRQVHVDLAPSHRNLARRLAGNKSLFFCEARYDAEALAHALKVEGVNTYVHHGSVSAEEREEAEASFQSKAAACIVCTSSLELGIDVGELEHVHQANVARTVSATLQRMGRTGRREGTTSNTCFWLFDPSFVLQAIATVDLIRKGWVEPIRPNRRCWSVLVHQVFTMSIQLGGVTPRLVKSLAAASPAFSGIEAREVDLLLAHMVRAGWLEEGGGKLSMSDHAVRRFGRSNNMELCAVFMTPTEYTVVTQDGREIGKLDREFVDMLQADHSSFLLAGRAWLVETIIEQRSTLLVRPDDTGRPPKWNTRGGSFKSRCMTEAIWDVLTRSEVPLYLSQAVAQYLAAERAMWGPEYRHLSTVWLETEGNVTWWTWAGGAINNTLRLVLQPIVGGQITCQDEKLDFRKLGVPIEALKRLLVEMREVEWWRTPSNTDAVIDRLPNARLSRFQDCLPRVLQLEMIARDFTDFNGTMKFLGDT